MNKTNIEWADVTWNPVTGCLRGCDYCYARRIANRFCRFRHKDYRMQCNGACEACSNINEMPALLYDGPFPFGFSPTFYPARLNDPQRVKKPKTIFVCSMADLFGEWVSDTWIDEVFTACRKAPQHRYLFLTKNPARYMALDNDGRLPTEDNFWYGSTVTGPDGPFWWSDYHNTFVSIEPLLKPFERAGEDAVKKVGWIIIGAMTGPGSKKHQPERWWVDNITHSAQAAGVPIFMKGSLLPIMGKKDYMIREFPWDKETGTGKPKVREVRLAKRERWASRPKAGGKRQ